MSGEIYCGIMDLVCRSCAFPTSPDGSGTSVSVFITRDKPRYIEQYTVVCAIRQIPSSPSVRASLFFQGQIHYFSPANPSRAMSMQWLTPVQRPVGSCVVGLPMSIPFTTAKRTLL
ncbi:hypothetical protein BC628DRAFT_815001 [Trametes gibbosa]|nr:hypothetical protein BC628DRAFT_815001 [Trametes gibbosa]